MPPKPVGRSTSSSRRALGVAGIAIIAAATLVVVALVSRKNETPAPVTTPVAKLHGIPQSGRVLGSPQANVELIEFADPQCPGCRYYALNILPKIIDEYVRPGKVRIEYHAFPFIGPDSIRGARFVLAAGLQNRLWQLHEALYRNQGAENSGWLTDALVRRLAREIPGLEANRLFRDALGKNVGTMLDDDLKEVQTRGLNQTPSFLVRVGNQAPYALSVPLEVSAFRRALDDALRG
jgi:protein-disulfide isomerase